MLRLGGVAAAVAPLERVHVSLQERGTCRNTILSLQASGSLETAIERSGGGGGSGFAAIVVQVSCSDQTTQQPHHPRPVVLLTLWMVVYES